MRGTIAMTERSPLEQQRIVLIPAAELSRDVANFMIGFGTLSIKDNVERVESKGSGTLVTIGSVQGILTAEHVLKELPDSGRIAIIFNCVSPSQFRKATIEMQHAIKLPIGRKGSLKFPPDLGFLRLAPADAASIGAIGSFYNISKRAEDVLGNKTLSPNLVEAIAGIVDERTTVRQLDDKTQATTFECIFCQGRAGPIGY
jgi:hypothetical protein